jgi:hypothetical protein
MAVHLSEQKMDGSVLNVLQELKIRFPRAAFRLCLDFTRFVADLAIPGSFAQ